MILRDYQETAVADLLEWFERHNEGHPIVEAAVGAGKSVMLAWLCQHALTTWGGTRIIMLVPQKELLEQNLDKLLKVWPEAPVGIHSASVGRKDLGHDILIATIGSIHKKAHELGRVDLLFVDECHLIPNSETGTYRSFIAALTKYNPHLRVVGWTGTPFRGNGEWLTVGDEPIFTHIATRVTMTDLLEAGYLSRLVSTETNTRLSADGVGTSGGDYIVSQLAAAIDRPELVEAACAELVRLAANRNKWLVYCVTIEHASHVRDALAARGIAVAMLTGNTPKREREEIIEQFRNGTYRAIVNVAVLTTGFDVPEVDCIALLRNTKSPVLYVQIAGRGMRIADGKSNCLWLDFTDTTERLGPVDRVRGRNKRRSNGEAPVKVCEECGSLNPISATQCSTCGTLFPVEEVDPHSTRVSAAQIISSNAPTITTYEVSEIRYSRHQKLGKQDSMRVDYWSGNGIINRRVASEWICIEHSGYAGQKARAWWNKRCDEPVETIESALFHAQIVGIKEPKFIRVNDSLKYPEIVSYHATNPDQEKEAA